MDVLELAKQRRATLATEISKLDQFIATGEELLKGGELQLSPAERAEEPPNESQSEKDAPSPLRQFSAGPGTRD